jgi:ATP-binding cassette subfamily B protein
MEALQFFSGFGLTAWLLMAHLSRGGELGGVLLLVYWALRLPVIGQDIALLARQYPAYRNTVLRLLEPLGAPADEEPAANDSPAGAAVQRQGARIAIEGVTVQAAGHTILEGIDLAVEPGSHIAIVGPSGAGKSSLVGLLLGWHRAALGQVLVDGAPLDSARLERLRRETAWVDPAVQLWNRSLFENLHYGASRESVAPVSCAIEMADLASVLEKLPDGLQTALGEGGALVSGGEGQRVRLGRAALRQGVRLVILDEPFRGLDRERRRELLARARNLWRDATLLCITHDVAETLSFDRVLVIEGGRVVEAGVPGELARQARSRYSDLLCAEELVRKGLWGGNEWRRLLLERGELTETRAVRVR